MIQNISVSELNNLNDIILIDVRSIEKYNSNHIQGSINIPSNLILSNPSKYLNKKNKYYIYCQKGIQSKKICLILKNLGYNVVNVLGGYEAWILRK